MREHPEVFLCPKLNYEIKYECRNSLAHRQSSLWVSVGIFLLGFFPRVKSLQSDEASASPPAALPPFPVCLQGLFFCLNTTPHCSCFISCFSIIKIFFFFYFLPLYPSSLAQFPLFSYCFYLKQNPCHKTSPRLLYMSVCLYIYVHACASISVCACPPSLCLHECFVRFTFIGKVQWILCEMCQQLWDRFALIWCDRDGVHSHATIPESDFKWTCSLLPLMSSYLSLISLLFSLSLFHLFQLPPFLFAVFCLYLFISPVFIQETVRFPENVLTV